MVLLKYINSSVIFNLILFFSFSVCVNSFTDFKNINIIFYIFFHLTFIYFLFYHFHILHYFLALIYGVLFDILLLNSIGSHLISFIGLILIYELFKKYLFLLSSYQIAIVIFVTLNFIIYFEFLLAYLLNNILFTVPFLLKYLFFSIIIFIPSIFVLNKIDR